MKSGRIADLYREILKLKNENDEIIKRIEVLEKEKGSDNIKNKNEELEKRIKDLKNQMEKNKVEKEKLEKRNCDLESALNENIVNLGKEKIEVSKLKDILKSQDIAKNEEEKCKKELNEILSKNKKLKESIENLNKENQKLILNNKELEDIKEKSIEKINNLTKTINEKEKEYKNKINSLEKQLEELKMSSSTKRIANEEKLRANHEREKIELKEQAENMIMKLEKENIQLKEKNSSLKNEKEEYEKLFYTYENILNKISEIRFDALREKLNLSSKKTKKDQLKIACLMYNLDICKIIYEYYSKDTKNIPLEDEDKELFNLINNFYIESNVVTWDVFFLPDEKFEKMNMYDLEKPDRTFNKVEEIYSPGLNLKGNNITLRAVVKGK